MIISGFKWYLNLSMVGATGPKQSGVAELFLTFTLIIYGKVDECTLKQLY